MFQQWSYAFAITSFFMFSTISLTYCSSSGVRTFSKVQRRYPVSHRAWQLREGIVCRSLWESPALVQYLRQVLSLFQTLSTIKPKKHAVGIDNQNLGAFVIFLIRHFEALSQIKNCLSTFPWDSTTLLWTGCVGDFKYLLRINNPKNISCYTYSKRLISNLEYYKLLQCHINTSTHSQIIIT